MKLITNYVSLVLTLLVTLTLTSIFVSKIATMVENVGKTILVDERMDGVVYRIFGDVKTIVVNTSIAGDIVSIVGNYTVEASSTDYVVIITDPREEIIIVTTRDIYIV